VLVLVLVLECLCGDHAIRLNRPKSLIRAQSWPSAETRPFEHEHEHEDEYEDDCLRRNTV
jgi:hypothetical protein